MRKAMLAAAAALLVASCQQPPPPTAAAPETPFRTIASIQEIMAGIVMPAADGVWQAVGTATKPDGTFEDRMPVTDEDWLKVRYRALELAEGANLVMMEGRNVAPPGRTIQDEGAAGNLSSAQIQAAIAAKRADFLKYAHDLQDAVGKTLTAIDAKDPDKLVELGGDIDAACEACHTTFWYPASAPTTP